jgi:hypothetical protein
MRGQGRHAHGHDGPFGGRQRPDGGQELLCAGPIDDAQDRMTALGEAERPLPPVLGFLVAFDEPPPDQAVDQAAGRRRRSPDRLGQLPSARTYSAASCVKPSRSSPS